MAWNTAENATLTVTMETKRNKQRYLDVCKKRGYVFEDNEDYLIITLPLSGNVLCVEWSDAPTPEKLDWFLAGYTRGRGNTVSALSKVLSAGETEWQLPKRSSTKSNDV